MVTSTNRIRVVLAEKNITNRWLAEKMGKSEITISRWSQNKSQPSLEQLREIAKLFIPKADVRLLVAFQELL